MNKSIGLKRGTVRLAPYDPGWATEYECEKTRLSEVIDDVRLAIEHVGSTAVPDLDAKPIIDILLGVNELSVHKELIRPLQQLGYEFMPERVFADRVFLPKGPRSKRTHYLSIVVKGGDNWNHTLAFRDLLRKDVAARKKYQAGKVSLAEQYQNDRASYTKHKEKLIRELLAEKTSV